VQRIGISDSAVKPGALPKRIAYSQFCVPLPLFRAVRQMISDLPAAAHEKDMVRSRPPNFFVAPQGRPAAERSTPRRQSASAAASNVDPSPATRFARDDAPFLAPCSNGALS
jgi:hypothetical protein